MRKFLMVSDLHVDAKLGGQKRFEEFRPAVERTIECAVREKVDGWFFLGDWCDPDNIGSFRGASYACEVAETLNGHGIASYWLVGNHDVIEDGCGTSTLSPLKSAGYNVLDRPRQDIVEALDGDPGFELIALPYASVAGNYDPRKFIEMLEPSGYPTLIVGHLMAEGVEPGSETSEMPRGRDVFWPLAEIGKKYPNATVVGGHYHRRQVFKRDGVWLQIVGSLQRLSHGEAENQPGFMIVGL